MLKFQTVKRGRHGRDYMVIGFTITMYLCNLQSLPMTTNVVSSNPANGVRGVFNTLCDKYCQ